MLASMLFADVWQEQMEDMEITGIAYDSRRVLPGNVFVCIKGFEQDGHQYAPSAEKRGAALIIAEDPVEVSIPVLYVKDARKAVALAACRFYDHPSKKFKLIGVTGTNGKTTVTYLIKSILEEAGMVVGIIGTNQNVIGDKVLITQSTTPTTPNALELQQLFEEMYQGGADCVVMEVSSHALELDRVYGCQFDIGVFTNLTRDHLDFHKTMENYYEAKKKLFAISERGVINCDDSYGQQMIKDLGRDNMITVGIDGLAEVDAESVTINAKGVDFTVCYQEEKYPIHVGIPGKFSVYNALTAIGAGLQMGLSMDVISRGLAKATGVMGRVEVVPTDTDYTVIIDYAHTPDGLENIIRAVREFAQGRVITLFGCGGDRDSSKRRIMGEIAGNLSDYTIITSDNPRTEDPEKIINMIVDGIEETDGEFKVIVNRREAIDYALSHAQKNDVVILAGKGQETYQIIGKEKYDFDERVVVYQCLNKTVKQQG